MAARRDHPYGQFNFLVDLGGGVVAGFRDMTTIAADGTATEYRDGAAAGVSVPRLPGLNKSAAVTLKRGVIRASDLAEWLKELRLGGLASGSPRTVSIRLQNEDHSAALRTWTLSRSRIVKFEAPDLGAKGNEVEIGTLALSGDGLVVEELST